MTDRLVLRETLSMEGTVNSVLHESNGDGA